MKTLCRIAWKSKITGYENFGDWHPISQEKNLLEWVKMQNSIYPEIYHYLENK